MKNLAHEPQKTTLTTNMDVGTSGFDELQMILLKKASEQTEAQKRKLDLLALRYQMEDYINSDASELKTVGDFLNLILATLQIKKNLFANYIGLKPANFSKLIRGDRPINYDLAMIFGKLFHHEPMLWLEIQAKNALIKLNANQDKYAHLSLRDLVNRQKSA